MIKRAYQEDKRILCQNEERFKYRFLLSLTDILSTGNTEGYASLHKAKHSSGQSEVNIHLGAD